MVLNGEAFRRKLNQVARTVVHVEDTFALIALEVVMVRMPRRLVAGAVARQRNDNDVAIIEQTFQVPIDRSLAKARQLGLRGTQYFLW